ncbi:ABC transporter permease [Flavobacterium cheniae]|uniref:Putative ABC transport system permease protein n=1 Tax=Flavobacterium cheniae TaxID=295428 RepID=A0A562KQ10_9FLAO|nr:FtsX-like permease family protein [Flavobacterium cheniae]TDR22866.1 putative ABC transport system permease protein [Flavobacterium cheniae]TWH97273.1 putative ABC transport system permease protein [Flavobacterium cheniae]
MIAKLAWKNIWFKPLNTILSVVLLTSSVAIITTLVLVEKQFEEKFSSNIDGVDLVMGAQGSPLQLILSSVYQVDSPTGNISYDSAKVWMQHPFVQKAIPLAFGDNYRGYKILGTTPDYLEKYGAKIAKGNLFEKNFEVVIGSDIAQKLSLKIGDEFFGSHGDAAEGEVHDHYGYKVVGIAKPTGKVVDNLILCTIPSVWQMHGGHEEAENPAHGEEGHVHVEGEEHHEEADMTLDEPGMEITAVLLKFRNKMGIVTWPRIIAQNTKMQVASPAIEVNRLFSLFGIGISALQYLAYGIMLISGISIFIALYNTLKERENEFALMRVNGAKRLQLLKVVMIESLLLCVVGFIFGTILGRVGLSMLSNSAEEDFKMSFNPYEFIWEKEGTLFLLTIFVGFIAALIPAIKAYNLNISKTLANA